MAECNSTGLEKGRREGCNSESGGTESLHIAPNCPHAEVCVLGVSYLHRTIYMDSQVIMYQF